METVTVKILSKPKLREPVLIGGLPGMGYVGKIAAEHLVEELRAKKFAELYSPHFPHHVAVEPDGTLRLLRNDFYHASSNGKDLIIVVGDVQAVSSEGHHKVVDKILDVAEQFGVKQIFTLGGFATGRYSRAKPKVVGVVSQLDLIEKYKEHGFTVEKGGGPIIGASGLLIGMGKLRGMEGLCLLGETHGMLVDHNSAKVVLEVLVGILGIKVDMTNVEQRAKETERILGRIQKEMVLRERREKKPAEEETSYIG
ncbi:proteasome assembly chaperone family protein [Candidatus Micrarchaeota archaeon CG08_land_8_20_14_0_20_49_17]|nr:MAG: proteasome assembly chaperone family protein [Candidatus Micrarchaeota archaeon CG08_land_8_20_14_0_20_49_17]